MTDSFCRFRVLVLLFPAWLLFGAGARAQVDAPGFMVYQFPSNQIPRIDGSIDDWAMVPDSFTIPIEAMWDDSRKHPSVNKATLDCKVKVGWVKGLNRLYFLYEAFDNFWEFSQMGLKNDTYEVVVDADLSGGPHIDRFRHNPAVVDAMESYFTFQNVHAQNYHIFTPPAEGKEWTMVWGPQQWLKELPYANYAYNYSFAPCDSGTLRMEFYITPFDYASPEGPEKSSESRLREGKKIGLCWAIIDYDSAESSNNNGFWNLSKHHTMYGQASEQRLFTLMPLEPRFKKPIDAQWSFSVLDMASRTVAFRDESEGKITSWDWDFGDGTRSNQQHPIHQYQKPDKYVVTLYVKGPDGTSRRCKVWDVAVL